MLHYINLPKCQMSSGLQELFFVSHRPSQFCYKTILNHHPDIFKKKLHTFHILFLFFLQAKLIYQWECFLLEVNNRETIAATEANNDMYCLQNEIEKFPLK